MLVPASTIFVRAGNIIVPEKITNTSRAGVTWLKLLRRFWKCRKKCLYLQSTQEPGALGQKEQAKLNARLQLQTEIFSCKDARWNLSHTALNCKTLTPMERFCFLRACSVPCSHTFLRLTHEQLLWHEKFLQIILPCLENCRCVTLIATGWMVPPTSKLPFLNIITDVLFMQVPGQN